MKISLLVRTLSMIRESKVKLIEVVQIRFGYLTMVC